MVWKEENVNLRHFFIPHQRTSQTEKGIVLQPIQNHSTICNNTLEFISVSFDTCERKKKTATPDPKESIHHVVRTPFLLLFRAPECNTTREGWRVIEQEKKTFFFSFFYCQYNSSSFFRAISHTQLFCCPIFGTTAVKLLQSNVQTPLLFIVNKGESSLSRKEPPNKC